MEYLADRTALVTGGGTGIGLAIARGLRAAGARVIITGRRVAVLEEAAKGHDLIPQVMDVTDEQSVADAFAPYPAIDICIANAGIAEGQNIRTGNTAFYRKIMATNLDGTWFTLREALRRMDKEWGRVIAISSIAGVRGLKGAHAYTASKHGVVGLIRALA
ncbi:MAG: SDR family NAD(P)-dependent oxidoreductase, partial [Shimia sp.]